jgi:DNA-binding transcriptional LysR family regulator
MEMHQVRYFLALCEELNFTRAARRCGIAQPSLTKAIKTLESEMQGPLFYRSPVVRLTRAGEIARPLLEAVSRSAEEAKQCVIRMNRRQARRPIGQAVERGAKPAAIKPAATRSAAARRRAAALASPSASRFSARSKAR